MEQDSIHLHRRVREIYQPCYGTHSRDLMPLATETGRFAARRPNLQNMPRAGADDVGVRNFFIAPKGKVLLSLDFSQIELRVGAYYCRDEKMMDTYRTGGDIHDQTATVIFGRGQAQQRAAHHCQERKLWNFLWAVPTRASADAQVQSGRRKVTGRLRADYL